MENSLQGQPIAAVDLGEIPNQLADLVATISEWDKIASRLRGRTPYTDFSEAETFRGKLSRSPLDDASAEYCRLLEEQDHENPHLTYYGPGSHGGQLLRTQITLDRDRLCSTILPSLAAAAKERGLPSSPYLVLCDSIAITINEYLGFPEPNLANPEMLPQWQAAIALTEELKRSTTPKTPDIKPSTPIAATANDARDKWLYDQCLALVKYGTIIRQLSNKTEWEPIGSVKGIKNAANRYANSHLLPLIPPRQHGRPSGQKNT